MEPYTLLALGKILHSLIRTLKIKRLYHPVKHFRVYVGTEQIETSAMNEENEAPFTDLISEAASFGFIHLPEPHNPNTLIKFTGCSCEDNRVTKDICINDNKWCVRIAGKEVKYEEISDLNSSPANRQASLHVLSMIANVQICCGIARKSAKSKTNRNVCTWVRDGKVE